MRIIGGKLRGSIFEAPEGSTTRPMLDRIRQALFNILEHHDWGKAIGDPITGAHVMDAFCGTGALAFEALSRGATQATLFENDRNAFKTVNANATKLGFAKNICRITSTDTLHPPKADKECGLVFVAPPYRKGLIAPAMAALDVQGWIADNALIVAETAKKEPLELPANFVPVFLRTYADTALHFVVRA